MNDLEMLLSRKKTWRNLKAHPRIRIFEGKNVDEWHDIIGGNKGRIREHIRNGTMIEYTPYRKYLGLKSMKNNFLIKKFMTPKGIMTYEEAKKAFGWKQAETVRDRVRSDKYPDWYEL